MNKFYIVIFLIIILLYLIYQYTILKKINYLYQLYNLTDDQVDKFLNSKFYFSEKNYNTSQDFKNNKTFQGYHLNAQYTNDYYSIIFLLCKLGNVEKMYIANIDDTKSVKENQILYEKNLAKYLNVNNGKILDIGCGCGRIASHISKLTNSQVYGLNIDKDQIKDAIEYNKNRENYLKFIIGDYNDSLPFQNNYFNAIYSVQSLTFCKNLDNLFKEVHRILKPGGIYSILEFLLLENFDENNKYHKKLIDSVLNVSAAGLAIHPIYIEDSLKRNGFKIIKSEGYSTEKMLIKENNTFNKINYNIKLLNKLKLTPNYLPKMIDHLQVGINDWIEAEKLGLITNHYEIVSQKI